jgi:hypothetical protein
MRKYHFLSSLVIFVAGFALSAIITSMSRGHLPASALPEVAAQTTRQPSTLQKWEYRVVTRYIQVNQADVEFELNRLGEQGYEICGMSQSGTADRSGFLTITLRRPR